MKAFLLGLVFLGLAPVVVQAHSGYKNKDDCHQERRTDTEHCHHSEAVVKYYQQLIAGEATWYQAEVLRVIDGDSIKVNARIWLKQNVEVSVRLRGIDTPEIDDKECDAEKKLGIKARDFIRSRVGKEVILYNVEYAKFAGRVLADVYTTEFDNLSVLLIKEGLARPYFGGPRRSWCKE